MCACLLLFSRVLGNVFDSSTSSARGYATVWSCPPCLDRPMDSSRFLTCCWCAAFWVLILSAVRPIARIFVSCVYVCLCICRVPVCLESLCVFGACVSTGYVESVLQRPHRAYCLRGEIGMLSLHAQSCRARGRSISTRKAARYIHCPCSLHHLCLLSGVALHVLWTTRRFEPLFQLICNTADEDDAPFQPVCDEAFRCRRIVGHV